MPSPRLELAIAAPLFAIALLCACGSKNDGSAADGDAGAGDGSIEGSDAGDGAPVDAADAAIACAPRYVLSSDTTQLTLLGDAKPLWAPASADETIVAFASDVTSAVVVDEIPGNPARFAIVNVPFDRTKARRIVIENGAVTSPRLADRSAYWMLDDPSAPALRSVSLDAPGAQTAHTVTTFSTEPVPREWFIDGDAAYWVYDRPDPSAPTSPSEAVLEHAALAGDGTHVSGPTLGPRPASPPGQGGEPSAFTAAYVKGGYVYFALIAQSGNPPVASAFAVKREPVGGGAVEALGAMQTGLTQLFVTARYVYWVADLSTHGADGQPLVRDFAIHQSALDGSGTTKVAGHDPSNDLSTIPFVHVEGSVLYWFDGPIPTAKYLRAFCEE